MNRLKNTLFALASPPLVQDGLFSDDITKGEELVAQYDEALEASENDLDLNEEQLQAFEKLEDFLDENTGEEFVDLYYLTASLYNDKRWEQIRSLSKEIIQTMGWEYEMPKAGEFTPSQFSSEKH